MLRRTGQAPTPGRAGKRPDDSVRKRGGRACIGWRACGRPWPSTRRRCSGSCAGRRPGPCSERRERRLVGAREPRAPGRYQEVLVGRLARVAAEETPLLGRYRSEEDAASAPWFALAPQPRADALAEARRVLVRCLDGMPAEALARRARHPLFGEMDVPTWLALFLDHEGHHLYVARLRPGEALSRAGGAPER